MKNIDDLLYPDFLQDEEVYDQLEAYYLSTRYRL
jgi:hypothetical protein